MRAVLAIAGAVMFVAGVVLLALIFSSLPISDGVVDQFEMADFAVTEPLVSLFTMLASTAVLCGAIFLVGACLIRRPD